MSNVLKMLYMNFLIPFDTQLGNMWFVNKMICLVVKDPEAGMVYDEIIQKYGKEAKSCQKVSVSRIR